MNADMLFAATVGVAVLGCIAIACVGYGAHALWHWITHRPAAPTCRHDVQSNARWTQDGWVTVCLVCREWLYHGDDYEGGPK